MKRPNVKNRNNFKRDTQSHAVKEVFKEFCSQSSIHGVQYFSERERHWSERYWWLIAFGLSVWLCGSSIHNIWTKWHENPVTMSITEKEAPISSIPFPTVVLCPETKANMRKLNVTSVFHSSIDELSNIELVRAKALVHLCKFVWLNFEIADDKYTNESIYDIIRDIAPSFSRTMYTCMWQYKLTNCSELFAPVLTQEGLCFAFNSLNSREIFTKEMAPEMMIVKSNPNVSHWNLENGYDDGFNGSGYPLRIFNARQEVMVRLYEEDLEYMCRGPIHGFKLFLHTPGQVLKTSRHSFRIPLSEVAEISINPKLITTSEELRDYEPNQRKCYFSSERRLRFFRYYAQHNCEAECLANFTKQQCGCVKFSMPRDRNTRICGASSILCYQEVEKRLFGEDVIDGLQDSTAKLFCEECNCLAACTSIVYGAEIDRAKFDWKATLNSYNFTRTNESGMRPAGLMISFRDHEVVTLRRTEKYSYTDFLAICGGLLGLFLGASALSVIEFIYYSTLRLFWTLRQQRSRGVVVPFERRTIRSRTSFHNSHGHYNAHRMLFHKRF